MPYYNCIWVWFNHILNMQSKYGFPICSKIVKSLKLCRSLTWRFAWRDGIPATMNYSMRVVCLSFQIAENFSVWHTFTGTKWPTHSSWWNHCSSCVHSQHSFQQQGHICSAFCLYQHLYVTTLFLPPPYHCGTHSHTQLLLLHWCNLLNRMIVFQTTLNF